MQNIQLWVMELHNKEHIWDSSENTQIIAEQIQNRHNKYPEVWHSNHNMELFHKRNISRNQSPLEETTRWKTKEEKKEKKDLKQQT